MEKPTGEKQCRHRLLAFELAASFHCSVSNWSNSPQGAARKQIQEKSAKGRKKWNRTRCLLLSLSRRARKPYFADVKRGGKKELCEGGRDRFEKRPAWPSMTPSYAHHMAFNIPRERKKKTGKEGKAGAIASCNALNLMGISRRNGTAPGLQHDSDRDFHAPANREKKKPRGKGRGKAQWLLSRPCLTR